LNFGKFLLEAQNLDHPGVSDQIQRWITLVKFCIPLFDRDRGKWIHKVQLYHNPGYAQMIEN
jgi:hypothetical protein